MKAPTLSRIWPHSVSSLGSKTTHWVPSYRLDSRNSAKRRIGTYFHSRARLIVALQRARAPDDVAVDRKLRRQLMA